MGYFSSHGLFFIPFSIWWLHSQISARRTTRASMGGSLDGISSSYDMEFDSGWPFMAAFLQVVWVGDPQRVSIYQSHNTTLCKQTEGQWDALALHSISLCPGTKRLCDASRPGRCNYRRIRHACDTRGIIPTLIAVRDRERSAA